jgi:hypothetical protein
VKILLIAELVEAKKIVTKSPAEGKAQIYFIFAFRQAQCTKIKAHKLKLNVR